MKKIFLLISFIVIIVILDIFIYFFNCGVILDNREYYKFFEEEKLVGIDGKISLAEIKSEKDKLYAELHALFQNDDSERYLEEIDSMKSVNVSLEQDIDELSLKISELGDNKNSLSLEYDVLINRYDKLRKSTIDVSVSTNDSYNFPLINQYPNYPTGCESVALTMLLRYYGVSVNPDQIIAKLKKGSVPYWENGVLYGGNPEVEFIGNPYSSASYGVYEKPMADVANLFKSGVQARSNFSFNEVIGMVKSGKPVMVWTSMGLAVPYISHNWTYKPTMEVISWKANEHAVVMVDANDSSVIVADPIGGKMKTYSRALFEQRYNYYGKKVLYY